MASANFAWPGGQSSPLCVFLSLGRLSQLNKLILEPSATNSKLRSYLVAALKRKSIVSTVSFGQGSNFHCLIASRAAPISNGLPPRTWVFLMLPSGETMTSSLTFPVSWNCRANSGYFGSTFVVAFRVIGCWSLPWENAEGDEDNIPSKTSPRPELRTPVRTLMPVQINKSSAGIEPKYLVPL